MGQHLDERLHLGEGRIPECCAWSKAAPSEEDSFSSQLRGGTKQRKRHLAERRCLVIRKWHQAEGARYLVEWRHLAEGRHQVWGVIWSRGGTLSRVLSVEGRYLVVGGF